MDADALIEAVHVVADGGSYLHPKVTHNLVKEYRRLVAEENSGHDSIQAPEIRRPLHLLTKRECEVLQLLADGQSNRTIGESYILVKKQ